MRPSLKIQSVLLATLLALIPLAFAPAHAEAAGTTACYLVGVRSDYKNWGSDALTTADKGFKGLNTNYTYTMALRGTLQKGVENNYSWYRFTPSKFGIKGTAAGNASANPKGQALGARVQFSLYSTKKSASYGIAIPIQVGYSWSSDKKVKVVTSKTHWENTAKQSLAGDMGWANAFIGAAGSNGLYKVTVRSAVFPGSDSGAYNAPLQSWSVSKYYESKHTSGTPSKSMPGLSGINCSSIDWSN